MKPRHTHKSDWIQRTKQDVNANQSIALPVHATMVAKNPVPKMPKAQSEEEHEYKKYKCSRTKRAHRKAHRKSHRQVKSDSEASEESEEEFGMFLY
jgi:hypothetical protein